MTSDLFKLMRYLLDKNIVRYVLQGLLYGQVRSLSDLEFSSLSFLQRAERHQAQLFISWASFRVLRQLQRFDEVHIFLDSVETLFPARYHVRWTRRLRETSGLSREDAGMIALSTFGTDETERILGTHFLVTYDQAMINGYQHHRPTLQRRLTAMTRQLNTPYHQATLPMLITPDEFDESDPAF